MKKKKILLLLPLFGILLSGCGNNGGNAIPVESVSLDKTEITLPVDAEETLTATISPDTATDKSVKWTTSNKDVATVLGGKIHAYTVGSATITVTTVDGDKTASCSVTVKEKEPEPVHVNSVVLNKNEINLGIGDSETLISTVLPANATNKGITWSTTDPEVASIDGGVVTALKAGTAVIKATSNEVIDGVSKYASCAVVVDGGPEIIHVSGVTISPNEASVVIGKTIQLAKVISPSNATDKSVIWSSDNESIASVSDKGLVLGVGVGNATIIATTTDGGFTATCALEVTNPPASEYSAIIGGNEIPLAIYDGEKGEDTWIHQYYANIASVTAGQSIDFTHNGTPIGEFTSPGEGNNAGGSPCKVLSSADNVMIYLKEYDTGWQVWLSGYHLDYYVKVGSGDPIKMNVSTEPVPSGFSAQYEQTISVTEGDVLSFYSNEIHLDSVTGDPAEGNNVDYTLTVLTTATNVKVYLKLCYGNDQCWLCGYQEHENTYSVSINGGAYQALTVNELETEASITNIALNANDTLSFKRNDAVMNVQPSLDIGVDYNNVALVDSVLKVKMPLAASSDKGIFLKLLSPLEVWVSGYVMTSKFVMEVNHLGAISEVAMSLNSPSTSEYCALDQHLESGDLIRFIIDTTLYDYRDIKESSSNKFSEGSFKWIKCDASGDYDLYVETSSEAGIKGVYIGEPTPPEPVYAYVLNDDDPVTLTPGTDPSGNPQLEALNIEMNINDTIYFENISPSTPEVLTSLTIGGDNHGFAIDNGVLLSSKEGTFNFYVKLAMGADVVYISESAGPTPAVVTYTVTLKSGQSWAFGTAGIPVFVWAWSTADDGTWVKISYTVGSTSTSFELSGKFTHFLLVRCANGTTQPDWNKTDDGPGKIYNKTDNVDIISGITTYELNWL